MSADYEVYVCDAYRNRLAQVHTYNALEYSLLFNDVGEWVIDMPYQTFSGDGLVINPAVAYFAWGGAVEIRRNGSTVISGPTRKKQRKFDKRNNLITFAGYDDMVYLNDRIAYPDVTGDFTLNAYDERSGAFETVAKEYVYYNAGAGAMSFRQVPGLTIDTDLGTGGSVSGSARFDNLLEMLQALAIAGGDYGFGFQDNLEFYTYLPEDKTDSVVFSVDLGTLRYYNYTIDAARVVNYVLVAGGGEGTARIIRKVPDTASITRYGLIEMFRDRRDTTDTDKLDETGEAEIDKRAERVKLVLVPIEIPGMEAFTDWQLGDKVTAIVDGERIQNVIREINVSVDKNGEQIEIGVGTPDSIANWPLATVMDRISGLDKRLSNLERI